MLHPDLSGVVAASVTPVDAQLQIDIDRLGYLHDLYGEEARFEILSQVNELLRSSTRSSDLLGFPMGDRILAAVTHIEAPHAEALAGRIISGTRGLVFDADGRSLRITASIGLAHSDDGVATFEELIDAAESARRDASEKGGDRLERFRPVLPPEPAPAPVEEPAAGIPGGDALLAETMRRVLVGEGSTDLAQDLLKRVLDEVEERYARADDGGRTELLERRVAKLGEMLERTEGQLRRVLAGGGGEEGVASIYKEVQGLDADENDAEHKRDLLKAVFDANMRMKRMIDEGETAD